MDSHKLCNPELYEKKKKTYKEKKIKIKDVFIGVSTAKGEKKN
jgi:hypothetical protein